MSCDLSSLYCGSAVIGWRGFFRALPSFFYWWAVNIKTDWTCGGKFNEDFDRRGWHVANGFRELGRSLKAAAVYRRPRIA